ncbi:MAG: L-threonylcarbamoyladenylate synthase [Oscillospiraceae bacterium]
MEEKSKLQTLVTAEPVEAADIIKRGGLVAVPTETVYGLAGNGLNRDAVHRIYEVKGRPEIKPLSLMVPDADAFSLYCEDVPPQAGLLAERFWPGPLTIVLKSKPIVPDITRAGGDTIGLRCPDHPLTLALLRSCGLPLAAPSANPSSAPSPKTAGEVMAYFDGAIDAVIDGGPCGIGLESTIIDLSFAPYRILRQGALPQDEIADALVSGMTLIGVTGGTGTGKTTALAVLEKLGALAIDCDEVYHGLTETSAELKAELEARFGRVYSDGRLDRKAIGEVVFADASALAELNAITHRHVGNEITRRLRAHAMAGGTLAAIDAIALIESKTALRCSKVFGVTADIETRAARIMSREGISREYAEKRINAQKTDDFYIENCDAVLRNSGTKEEFAALCETAFMEVLKNGNKKD